ncbi:hypothetical protein YASMINEVIRUS_430 [Yasminevirus sp. GU-2018]|uniref:Uncharacterized protein n=1 Tax=Yasminevirus sp. GU-2018 TaxID=2420051 RepID=A0A5K0U806_9VIRU|nr:hypothetical protein YASMINEVIRUS_430 [Yasminevirus sp. GU-2018]
MVTVYLYWAFWMVYCILTLIRSAVKITDPVYKVFQNLLLIIASICTFVTSIHLGVPLIATAFFFDMMGDFFFSLRDFTTDVFKNVFPLWLENAILNSVPFILSLFISNLCRFWFFFDITPEYSLEALVVIVPFVLVSTALIVFGAEKLSPLIVTLGGVYLVSNILGLFLTFNLFLLGAPTLFIGNLLVASAVVIECLSAILFPTDGVNYLTTIAHSLYFFGQHLTLVSLFAMII